MDIFSIFFSMKVYYLFLFKQILKLKCYEVAATKFLPMNAPLTTFFAVFAHA